MSVQEKTLVKFDECMYRREPDSTDYAFIAQCRLNEATMRIFIRVREKAVLERFITFRGNNASPVG